MRVFLAIPLPAGLIATITTLQRELSTGLSGIRWNRSDNMHLTLRFFAEVTQEDLEKIKVSVLSVSFDQGPFEVEVNGLGAFPNLYKPRVLWLGLQPQAPLKELFLACETALRQAGVEPESRSFAPHLTIGRLRQRGPDMQNLATRLQPRPLGTLPVTRLVLYESRLHRSGAEHIPLLTVDLAKLKRSGSAAAAFDRTH